MIFVHKSGDATFSYLLEFDPRGLPNLEQHILAAIPAGDRQFGATSAHWEIKAAALPVLIATALTERTTLQLIIPPQPAQAWPYRG